MAKSIKSTICPFAHLTKPIFIVNSILLVAIGYAALYVEPGTATFVILVVDLVVIGAIYALCLLIYALCVNHEV